MYIFYFDAENEFFNFFFSLERWLQRSNSCPTCRKRTKSGLRLFFSNEQDFSSIGAQNGNDLKLITVCVHFKKVCRHSHLMRGSFH